MGASAAIRPMHADDLPALVEMDVHSEIGSIHDLITNYIVSVKNGRLLPECDNKWRLIIEPGAD